MSTEYGQPDAKVAKVSQKSQKDFHSWKNSFASFGCSLSRLLRTAVRSRLQTALRNFSWFGKGTDRRKTSSPSHSAARRARSATIGSGICT